MGAQSRRIAGPMDLRLAPLALGCWGAALATLHTGWRAGFALAGLALLAGGAVLLAGSAGITGRDGAPALTGLWRWRWIVVAAAVGIACGAATTAARLGAAGAPELAALVSERVTAEAELAIGDDPRLARSGTWVVPARLRAVQGMTMDVGVLVLGEHEGWRGLQPGQRVRVTVRFGPSRGGDLRAALLSAASAPTPLGAPSWPQRAAATLRAGLQRACEPLDDGPGGLLPGLVVGDTSRLPAEVEQQFRDVGLTHLTAVSGSNVAIVVGFVVLAARWCRLGQRWAAGLALIAVVGFVILVRPSPSVLRAAAMGGIGLLALGGGRFRAALPALCATIAALVIVDPELASDAGFALSVLATAGLLLIAPPMRDALRRKGVPAGVAEALAIPASAQLACAPVVAGISGSISLVAIPANLLAVPAIAPATLTGVAAAVVSPVWPDAARFAAWLGGWPAWWLVKVGEIGSGVPGGSVAWPGGVGGALLLGALTILALLGFRHRRVRLVAVVLAVAAAVGAVPVRLLGGAWPPSDWVVVACDVGQGDAIVLRAGPAAAVVVDTGPEASAVDGCLRGLGIDSVPLAVLSHLHLDHIGGLGGLLRHRPGLLVTPAWAEPRTGHDTVARASARAGVPVTAAAPGAMWTVGEVTVRVLFTAPLRGTRSDPNNNSVILAATVRGVRVLLLGDAETEQQSLLRATHPQLGVDVLKVAHHGSAYQDPALLSELRPRVALVSVGRDNGYGHPHASVLAALRRSGAGVWRTDVDGDVAVVARAGGLVVVRGVG